MKRVYEFLLWLIGAGLLVVLVLLAERANGREVTYAEAYDAYNLGQPMVVVCSASWCPACHKLINELKPIDVAFVVLDVEHPPSDEIKAAIYPGGNIPQTVVWIPKRKINPVRRVGQIGLAGVRALLEGK